MIQAEGTVSVEALRWVCGWFSRNSERGQCIWGRVNKGGRVIGDNYYYHLKNHWRGSYDSSLLWVYVVLLQVQKWKAFSELEIFTLEETRKGKVFPQILCF